MFVPIILGSDKTTVSVGTGNNEYYPLYISIGNVHNNVRHAHRNALALLGFLSIPKCKSVSFPLQSITEDHLGDKQHENDPKFCKFRCQLFHLSLSQILWSLKPGMMVPEVIRCPDGHFQRAIYGLGPYIADYPEQVLLSCVVQGCCPRYALIHFNFNLSKFYIHRCRAPRDNLDIAPDQGRHSHKHTDLLVETLELGVLWDEFGIVGDVIVSSVCKVSHLCHSYSFLAIYK
jgi:Plavaka transposase